MRCNSVSSAGTVQFDDAHRDRSFSKGSAWALTMGKLLASRLGESPQRETIIRTIAHALTSSTAQSYGTHLARFIEFCEAQPDSPSPLPATTGTVLRWLAGDVCVAGRVQAGSLQPYLSAINRIHRDLDMEEPALGHLISSFKRGLGHLQADTGRQSERVYLPASIVQDTLDWALTLELGDATLHVLSAFRAAVAVVLTYILFARGDTGSHLLAKELRRGPCGELLITLSHEKGKRSHARARLLTIPSGSIRGLDQLLTKWETFRGVVQPDDSYYVLPSETQHAGRGVRAFASSQIDTWLTFILGHLGVAPPEGETWSGHSLRKGAASASSAIGVSINRICYMGGWSIHGKTYTDYIDPTCPACRASYRFFGWLLPAAMRLK